MGMERNPTRNIQHWGGALNPGNTLGAGFVSVLGSSEAASGTGQEGKVTGSNRLTQPLLEGQIKCCCASFVAVREDISASIHTRDVVVDVV